MDETVDLLWAKVEEAWHEDKRHQAFIAYCQGQQSLGEAARRYRAIAEQPTKEGASEEDAAAVEQQRQEAKKRLAAITILAMATLDAQRSEPAKQPQWIRILAFIVLMAAIGMLVWAMMRSGGP